MALLARFLVVALLTLPVAAYVAGGLVAARSELPVQRPAVIVGDPLDTEPARTLRPSPTATSRPDDDGDGDDDADDADDDDLPIVRPEPRDLDDDDEDDGHDGDGRDQGHDADDD